MHVLRRSEIVLVTGAKAYKVRKVLTNRIWCVTARRSAMHDAYGNASLRCESGDATRLDAPYRAAPRRTASGVQEP